MKIVQPDSRSIRIVSDSGVTFHVPYRFFWNDNERPAESVVLTTGTGSARALVRRSTRYAPFSCLARSVTTLSRIRAA